MYKVDSEVLRRRKNRPKDLDHRVDVGRRLRSMYLNLGMQRPDVAKYLQVSERTLHNWESGRHVIPFAVYKLLRLLSGMDLPGPSWEGWRFQGGKLYTPEGHGFTGKDGSWWSLLVRRAAMFDKLAAENVELRTSGAAVVGPRLRGGATAAPQGAGLVSVSTSGICAGQRIQDDVKLTSWPTVYDSPKPLTLKPVPVASVSASPSMHSFAWRLTPICGGLLSLSVLSVASMAAQALPGSLEAPLPPSRPPSSYLDLAWCLHQLERIPCQNPSSQPAIRPRETSGAVVGGGKKEVLQALV